ncbi:DUF6188 family protein [Actinoplanes sp. Pm04-4]|uniref:DUF6188 family protein n=1 Tax=Paractinoplanes pyxinae TaxID=2997416 RepID=A0ABT4ASQ6_9ACTN|nr:DUF6188 family protein [Actinoplanes pyxinae]MCY1137276.1 DUF6188 family protein [Actinoplanes pyxinae]
MVPAAVAGRCPQGAGAVELLAGQRLDYVQLGPALVLGFSGDTRVMIEVVARLGGPVGRVEIEPGDRPSDALGLLLGDVVRTAEVGDSGELALSFEGGFDLCVGPHAEAESWAVAGADGCLVVCLAGGEVAAWTEAPSKVVIRRDGQ